jgi:hypothetical protein
MTKTSFIIDIQALKCNILLDAFALGWNGGKGN